MTKHTPGQWIFDDDCDEVNADGVPVAYVYGPDDFPCFNPDEDEQTQKEAEINCKANGRLVAAAPKLLEACKEMTAVIRKWRQSGVQDYGAILDAQGRIDIAVAEAEGRSC